MPRYKVTIEYDGTNSVGWQKQKDIFSIAEKIENAIYSFSNEKVVIYGSGRTDAGVHARGQVAHFDLETTRFDAYKVLSALNYYLKDKSISIIDCQLADKSFHARFSATKRYYQYIILNRSSPPVIEKNRVWHIKEHLDYMLMQQASNLLIGEHDFSSFRAAECQASSPVKTIDSITIQSIHNNIYIDISARSFLHHMVRNIVGSLKLVGNKKMSLEQFSQGFQAKNRKVMGVTAPAAGLYLLKVAYS